MNYVKINGISFDAKVSISEYEENFNVLDGSNSGRVNSGDLIRDVIGVYLGHKITFFRGTSNSGFDELWDYLVEHAADDSVSLEAADGQKSITYDAYYTSGSRKLQSVVNGVNYWDELSVNFIPISPQIRR